LCFIPPQEETSATVYDVPGIVGVFALNGEHPFLIVATLVLGCDDNVADIRQHALVVLLV
jgi:hypothetical protein